MSLELLGAYGTLTIDKATYEGDPKFCKAKIQYVKKRILPIESAVSERDTIVIQHNQAGKKAAANIQALRDKGLTEDDSELAQAIIDAKSWTAINDVPDGILLSLQSELESARSELSYWEGKLRRAEYYAAKAVKQGKVAKK